MPHCKNTQTIREIAKCFEKNTEKAMNDIANISHYVGSKLFALCQPGCKDMFYELQKSPVCIGLKKVDFLSESTFSVQYTQILQ